MDKYIVLIAQNDNITTDMFDSDTPIMLEETNIDESSFDNNQNQDNNSEYQNQDFNQDFSQNNNFDTTSEIPALPAVTPERPNEMQTVMEKSSISFGVLALIIVFILLAAYLFKKFSSKKQYKYTYDEPEEDFKQNLDNEKHMQPQVRERKRKGAKLNTPASIHQCIVSFLEITKEV